MNLEKIGLLRDQIKEIKKGKLLGIKRGKTRTEFKHLKKVAKKTNLRLENFFVRTGLFDSKNHDENGLKSFIREQKSIGEKTEITVHYFVKKDRWKIKKMIAKKDYLT